MADRIPLLDLKAQYRGLAAEIEPVVLALLASGQYVGGEPVELFEREFAAAEGAAHGAALSSGSAALRLALLACGVGPGHEVIVPAFSFIATSEAVTQVGATPVFADVDPDTLCLDPEAFEARIGPRTAAVIPVHLYGHPADLDAIGRVASARGVAVVQDAAQAHGARWRDQRLGRFGDIACYSFYPTKNLGSCGEGGAVIAADPERVAAVRRLRDHGQSGRYQHPTEGFNERMHALQAAILRVKLRHLDDWNDRRRAAAARYDQLLARLPLQRPVEGPGVRHAWHLYVIRSEHRDRIAAALAEAGIASAIHYPTPLHRLEPYAARGTDHAACPHAEAAAATVLSLPFYPELEAAAQERVAGCLETTLAGM